MIKRKNKTKRNGKDVDDEGVHGTCQEPPEDTTAIRVDTVETRQGKVKGECGTQRVRKPSTSRLLSGSRTSNRLDATHQRGDIEHQDLILDQKVPCGSPMIKIASFQRVIQQHVPMHLSKG
jgi:hypothetical protein